MRILHINEYRDYLKTIQGVIFQILPLYEDRNKFLVNYVSDTYSEVEHVLDIIDIMPNGAWYPSALSGLRILKKEVAKENNHYAVKKKVLHLTGLIQKQIESIEE